MGTSRRPAAALTTLTVLITTVLALVLPSTATSADRTEARKKEPYAGYLFTYFTGEDTADGEQIYFALSRGNDPLHWRELNGARPVLTSTLGDEGVRDPFVIRSPEGDRFYLIATDLKINGNGDWDHAQRHGSRSIMVWESTDLVHWSDQRSVQVSPPTAGNTWAPEAYWDPKTNQYVVFWASKLYAEDDPDHTGDTYNRMMYATTRDFVTFSAAKVWDDPGFSVIDSTVIDHDGTFYRFTKDERNPSSDSPCSKYILEEKSTDLLDTSWDFVSECIGQGTQDSPGISRGEGPTVFKSNTEDKWYQFIDEFGGRGYVPFESTDLDSGTWTMSRDYQLPASPRHGTVLPVTQAEYDRLAAELSVPAVQATKDGLVGHWPLDGSAADVSGHHYDGTLAGDASFADGALRLGGAGGHVKLPDNLLSGVDAVTVSADVWVDPAQQTPYFLFGFGNTAANGQGDGYLFATGGSTGSGLRAALSNGDFHAEQQAASARGLPRGQWRNVTYTINGKTAVLYLDGVEVARNDAMTLRPSDIAGGRTTANYLGRSQYTSDHTLMGRMRDVRLYNRALSTNEITALPSNATGIFSVDLGELRAPAVIDTTGGTVTLPVAPGTDLSRLHPRFTLAPGATISPRSGQQVDLSKPVTYTVTPAEGAMGAPPTPSRQWGREWTVSARVMRSPVLPGFNADPNIVAFGDTYYIYGTTDGFAGWGGTRFHAWSSKDLVHWSDHGVILDLGPDVSWADARAWAPTIAERNGRYYFYFVADTKIGVATSDTPTGPFTDSGAPLITANPDGRGQAIDPAVFVDDSGQAYLYWGNGSAWVVPLADDMMSFDPAQVRQITGLPDFREGLFMAERNGVYHLTYSIDDTRSENYRVGYATSSSPFGPFTAHGVVLQKDASLGILATGHDSIIRVPGTDEWYIAYHRFAIPDGDGTHRETTIDRLTFSSDGLIKPVTPTLESVDPRPIP